MPEPKQTENEKMLKLLLEQGYINEENFNAAKTHGVTHEDAELSYLIEEGIINKPLLGQAFAESMGVPYADLMTNKPSRKQVMKMGEDMAKKYRIVIYKEDKDGITLATDNKNPKKLLEKIAPLFKGAKVNIAYGLTEGIEESFVYYRKGLETRFAKIIKSEEKIAPEITDEIFADAMIYRASDIHFEPQEDEVVIRFRIDGVMHEAGRLPKDYYLNILNRVKVQAHLRIDEHFAAQDGAIRHVVEDKAVDMRVSIIPTLDGEKMTIRVLAEYVRDFTLNDLGFSTEGQEQFLEAGKKPFGMIIVTGPTGSGKTTTLYSLIKVLNKPEVNITTIEDPVEYKILGINQIQAKAETNLTFAEGLRSIVRQDPDIILVGEIRDNETAEIAVNAALTGHLLLSTFHANDAATAIPRIIDMGVEPFLLASTLEVLISQRLVRKICKHCIQSYTENIAELEKNSPEIKGYFDKEEVTLYKGKGCETCNHTGYHGRTAIFEMIYVTKDLKELILTNPSTQQIWDLAQSQGARSIFEDGMEKVRTGVTTLEELLRIAAPPTKNNVYEKQNTEKEEE